MLDRTQPFVVPGVGFPDLGQLLANVQQMHVAGHALGWQRRGGVVVAHSITNVRRPRICWYSSDCSVIVEPFSLM